MAEQLTRSLTLLAGRGESRGAAEVLAAARRSVEPKPPPSRTRRMGLVVVAAAVMLVIVIAFLDPFGGTEPARVVTTSPEVTSPEVTSRPVTGSDARAGSEISDTAGPGAIVISVRDWPGVDGYRLLAVVFGEEDLVGGAFWTLIDSDPFSGVDIVHPPYLGDGWDDEPHPDGWGAGDYLWNRTAWLEPGTYRIDFYANPGELAPYGSHLPSAGAELYCGLEVDVVAGEISTVTIPGIPIGGDPCEEIDS
jgi:hypothetical protein